MGYQQAAFSQYTFKMDLRAEGTRTMGDFGFDRGTYTMTLTPKAGGDPVSQEGRYLALLHKETDGTWKVSRDVDNSTVPMMRAPAPALDDRQASSDTK